MPRPVFHAENDLTGTICPLALSLAERGNYFPCFGRRCMSWRFADTHIANEDGVLVPSGDTHGFCGLAGDPRRSRSDELPY